MFKLNQSKNAGKKWSSEHHNQFIKMITENKDIDEIANKFERTNGSITCTITSTNL